MKITQENISKIDSDNMWGYLENFASQWEEVCSTTKELDLHIDASKVRNICFAGMGGAAIGADLIRAYSLNSCPHPIQICRHYNIPNYINEHTLFVACSYSGNTEETISALSEAINKGAQVICITAGGVLKKKAILEGFDYIQIPGGLPTRAALAYNFVPLFRIFQALGFLDESDEVLNSTHRLLQEGVKNYTDIKSNEALALAMEINGSLPIIYSDALMMAPVNLRWREQIGGNSKMLAFGNLIPEMNHNEIVGWEHINHLAGRLTVILLKDRDEHPKIAQRMEIVKELVMDQALSIIEINTVGESRLERMFSLVQLADWVSIYLALLNGIDPTPVTKIDLLKSKLSE